MRSVKTLSWLALALPLVLLAPSAPAAEWGKDYVELSPHQPVQTQGKVEVMEFFWYGCPHCYQLEPELHDWVKKLPKDVAFKRQPAVLNDSWLPLTRAYYAMEALGVADRLHTAVFRAVHEQRLNLNDPQAFFDWAAKQGVDRKKLASVYNSFTVNAKAARAKQLTARYKITGVPGFVVNGKYQTSAYLTGGHRQLFKTLDELVVEERDKKK